MKQMKNKRKRERRHEKKKRASMNLNETASAANTVNVAQASPGQSSVIIDLMSPPPESPHRVDQQSEGQQATQPDHDHDQHQRKKAKSKRKRERRNEDKRRASMNLNNSTDAANESADEEIQFSTPQSKAFASLPKDPKDWDLDF